MTKGKAIKRLLLTMIVASGTDIDAKDPLRGSSPLIVAALNGQTELRRKSSRKLSRPAPAYAHRRVHLL